MQQGVGLRFLGGGERDLALAPMDRAGGLEGKHVPPDQAGKEPAQFLGAVPEVLEIIVGGGGNESGSRWKDRKLSII